MNGYRKALDAVDGGRLLAETLRLVTVASPTGGEEQFARCYAESLEQLGLLVALDWEWAGSPSVVAWWRGVGGGPTLQLDGHTDTIGIPHRAPELDTVGKLVRGRGAADMKGGLAGVLEAIRALRDSGIVLRGDVLVTAHGMHEAPSGDQRTLRSLLRKGVAGDAAVIVELAHEELPIGARGMSIFKIRALSEGDALHEVELSDPGANPLSVVSKLLARLERRASELRRMALPVVGADSIFIGQVHGGDFYNRVPTQAEVVGTWRYAAPISVETVRDELATLCTELAEASGLSLELDLQEVGAPYLIDGSEPVVLAVQRAYRAVMGTNLPIAGALAVGNATDFVRYGIPAVYHGVNQSSAHSDDEYVGEADLVRAAKVYAASMMEFCGWGGDVGQTGAGIA
ncbi:MAG: M20 family metallopeptidase [Acidimicrobiales bacterium]